MLKPNRTGSKSKPVRMVSWILWGRWQRGKPAHDIYSRRRRRRRLSQPSPPTTSAAMAAFRLPPLPSTASSAAASRKPSPAVFPSRVSQPRRHPKTCFGACHLGKRGSLTVSAVAVAGRPEVEVSVTGSKVAKPVIVIDNYDSFTYNLCQYMGDLGADFEVYRNDEVTVEDLKLKNPRGILISPGPGAPQDSGISLETVLKLGPSIPLFGVCMGLQCIGEAFGGKIVRSPFGVMHGKSSLVYFDEKEEHGLFYGLSNPFKAGRYHSLVIENKSFPGDALEVTARTEDGLVMGVRHKIYKHIQGVQFHPESIITTEGKKIVQNFLTLVKHFETSQDKNVVRQA